MKTNDPPLVSVAAPRQGSMRRTGVLLAIALLLYGAEFVMAPGKYLPDSGGRGFTVAATVFNVLITPPFFHAILLGIPCLLIGLIVGRLRGGFRAFAVLYLLSGSVNAVGTAAEVFFFQPRLTQSIRELAFQEKIDRRLLPAQDLLVGHWRSIDGPPVDYYFGDKGAVAIVRQGTTQTQRWSVAIRDKENDGILIVLKLTDRPPETRGVFLGEGKKIAMIYRDNGNEVGEVLEHLSLEKEPPGGAP